MQELLDLENYEVGHFFRRTIRAEGNPSAEAVAKHMAFASYTCKVSRSSSSNYSFTCHLIMLCCLIKPSLKLGKGFPSNKMFEVKDILF